MLLRDLLKGVPAIEFLGIGPGVLRHGVYMAALRFNSAQCGGIKIDDYLGALFGEGVPGGRVFPKTISQQPAFVRLIQKHPEFIRVLPTPVAERAVNETFYIDQNVFLGTEADMEEIAAAFRKLQDHFTPGSWNDGTPKRSHAGTEELAPVIKSAPLAAGRKALYREKLYHISPDYQGNQQRQACATHQHTQYSQPHSRAPQSRPVAAPLILPGLSRCQGKIAAGDVKLIAAVRPAHPSAGTRR